VRAELADRHKKDCRPDEGKMGNEERKGREREREREKERKERREGAGDEMRILLGKRWKKQGAGSPG
jgi:hypothetical protein